MARFSAAVGLGCARIASQRVWVKDWIAYFIVEYDSRYPSGCMY